MKYIIYNPLSGRPEGARLAAEKIAASGEYHVVDMTADGAEAAVRSAGEGDELYILGGDGTLNRFINMLGEKILPRVFYFPCGTGNDFACDVNMTDADEPFEITEYLEGLPTVMVKGRTYRFINGVGFGIDGYCCEVGDKMKAEGKQPNYTMIAIMGLLFHFKAARATVTVDGVSEEYSKVWIAPTMWGRYYGGGMMAAPEQDRKRPDGKLSLILFHDSGRIKTLTIFPKIFKGEHLKHKKNVTCLRGSEITVRFDHPSALQIDGETVLDVTEYTVSAAPVAAPAEGECAAAV